VLLALLAGVKLLKDQALQNLYISLKVTIASGSRRVLDMFFNRKNMVFLLLFKKKNEHVEVFLRASLRE